VEKIKKLFQTTGTKQGSFSIGVTAIVIAIVVVANMIIGQLPEKYRNIDVSSTKIYEISDTSKDLLKELDHKVTLTVLAVKDETDDRITTFLSKYAGLSKNVSVKWIDPVLHPSALTENNAEKDTIVVKCEDTGKSTTVAFSDIIVQDMSSYYYTGSASESEFDGEGQLTSAINYVISDASQTVYRTSGHGESTFSTTISDLMKKNNYNVEELNLVMNTEIPDDCDLLMMYAPTNDLSQEEADVMKNYLKSGGKVMLILGDTTSEQLPNLMGILSDYGMKEADGYIADPKRCYQGNAYYLFPQLSVSGDLANGISSQMVLLVNTHGLELSDPARDTISVNAFMSTTNNAYAVTEDAQTEGSYTLGAVATESISKDDAEDENSTDDSETLESRLTVISSASMIDSQITDAFTTLENTTLFMNAVTANFDGVKNISIEPKSLSVEYNTVKHSGLLSLLVIFGVPIVLLIGGFSVWKSVIKN
jgi:ABC-2 type transport system permease protein